MRPLNKRALSHVLAISLITNPVYAGSIFEAASGAGRWLKTKLGASAPVPTAETTRVATEAAETTAAVRLPDIAAWAAHQDELEKATGGVLKNISERVDKNLYLQTIGRDTELTNYMTIMNNPNSLGLALEGSAGAGKSQISYGFQEAVKNNSVTGNLKNAKVIEVTSASSLIESADAFGTKLMALKTQLNINPDSKELIILHFSKIEKFLAEKSKGQFDSYVEKAQSILGKDRVKFVIEGSKAEINKLAENNTSVRNIHREVIAAPAHTEIEQIANKYNLRLANNMRFTKEALQKAIKYADTYLSELGQPYATIRLMDETAALKQVMRNRPDSIMATDIQKKINELEIVKARLEEIISTATTPVVQAKIKLASIPQKIAKLKAEQDKILKHFENFKKLRERAQALEQKARQQKNKSAVVLAEDLKEFQSITSGLNQVYPEDVALRIALLGKAKIDDLLVAIKPLTAEESMQLYEKKILGQSHILKYLKGIRDTITNESRSDVGPVRVMLMVGPPGVGKTSTAKAISEIEFGSTDKLIYEEMKKYNTSVSATDILGSPAGYIGHGEGGDLVSRLKSIEDGGVLLLDEAEAAHPSIWEKTFNRAFDSDSGEMTNTSGKTVKTKNIVVVITTNKGQDFTPETDISEVYRYFIEAGIFPRDLMNRIGEKNILVYGSVDATSIAKAFDEKIALFNLKTLDKEDKYLRISEKAKALLLNQGEKSEAGSVRNINRIILEIQDAVGKFNKRGIYEFNGRQIHHEGPLPGPGDLIELDFDDATGLVFKIVQTAE